MGSPDPKPPDNEQLKTQSYQKKDSAHLPRGHAAVMGEQCYRDRDKNAAQPFYAFFLHYFPLVPALQHVQAITKKSRAQSAATDVLCVIEHELATTEPPTLAGIAAIIRYERELHEGYDLLPADGADDPAREMHSWLATIERAVARIADIDVAVSQQPPRVGPNAKGRRGSPPRRVRVR